MSDYLKKLTDEELIDKLIEIVSGASGPVMGNRELIKKFHEEPYARRIKEIKAELLRRLERKENPKFPGYRIKPHVKKSEVKKIKLSRDNKSCRQKSHT